MIQKSTASQDKSLPKNRYVSRIKINGVPLLPPLITFEKSKELQRYKKEAVKIEEKLKCESKLRTYFSQYCSQGNSPAIQSCSGNSKIERSIELNLASLEGTHQPGILSSQGISVPSDLKGHNTEKTFHRRTDYLITATEEKSKFSTENVFSENSQILNLISNAEELIKNVAKNIGCTNDISLDLENSNQFLACDNKLNKLQCSPLINQECVSKPVDVPRLSSYRETNSPHKGNKLESNAKNKDETSSSPKPRLLRSNSYTLDSPSPILLEHLQKQGKLASAFHLSKAEQTSCTQNCRLDNNTPKEQSRSLSLDCESNSKAYKYCDTKNSSPTKDSGLGTETSLLPDNCLKNCKVNDNVSKSPTTSCKTESDCTNQVTSRSCTDEVKSNEMSVDSNDNPDNYPNNIFELLDTYKRQQQQRLESYSKLKTTLLGEIEKEFSFKGEIEGIEKNMNKAFKRNNKNNNVNLERDFENNFILSENEKNQNYSERDFVAILDSYRSCDFSTSSQTISISDAFSVDTLNFEPKTDLLIDLSENDQNQNNVPPQNVPLTESRNDLKSDIFDIMDMTPELLNRLPIQIQNSSRSSKCSRNLFPVTTDKYYRKIIEQRAATVLCAAVKGFLVRRLMKTERVQTLIQTIKEALMCAIELHSESLDKIQPADIELHRRLIQQVSAACYDFHDVFFALSKKEQMRMIAVDRQRLKMRKPLSVMPTPRKKLNFDKAIKSRSKNIVLKYKRSLS